MENPESGSRLALRPRRKRDIPASKASPVQSPKPKKKRKVAATNLSLREILKKLMTSPTGTPFTSAPSAADFPDYAERVDHIDLTMILASFNDGLYRGNDHRFISDVRRVWANAMEYFPPTSTRYQLADANQKDFEAYLERMEREKNPLKMMDARVTMLEKKMEDVLARLDQNERRKVKPPMYPELKRLSDEILKLPDEYRRGMVDLAPDHIKFTGAGACEINLENLPRCNFEALKKYIRQNCKKKPKKPPPALIQTQQTPPTADEDAAKSVKNGQVELLQARDVLDSDSSSSSSDSSSSGDEGTRTDRTDFFMISP